MMKSIIQYFLGLALILFLTACPAPGHTRTPLKITELSNTVWYYHQKNTTRSGEASKTTNTYDAGAGQITDTYFVLSFTGSGTSYSVSTGSSNNLNTAVQQSQTSSKTSATYDEKQPGQLTLKRNGGSTTEIFRPISQNEAELLTINGSSTGTKTMLTRYK